MSSAHGVRLGPTNSWQCEGNNGECGKEGCYSSEKGGIVCRTMKGTVDEDQSRTGCGHFVFRLVLYCTVLWSSRRRQHEEGWRIVLYKHSIMLLGSYDLALAPKSCCVVSTKGCVRFDSLALVIK